MTTTTAQKISTLLSDDGMRLTAEDGRSIVEICEDMGGRRDWTMQGDVKKYRFADGSIITIAGGAWDVGYQGCACWRGAGHTDECVAK